MIKTIKKSGNSASITLDKAILELLNLKIGDQVVLTVSEGVLKISPANVGVPKPELEDAAKEIFKRYGKTFKKLAE
jgi:putative addiction module antidote